MSLSIKEIVYNPTIVVITMDHEMTLDFFLELMAEYNLSLLQSIGYKLTKGFMDLRGKHLDDLNDSLAIEIMKGIESQWSKEQLKDTLDALTKLKNSEEFGSFQLVLGHAVRYVRNTRRTLILPDTFDYLDNLKIEGRLYVPDSIPSLNDIRRVELEL